MNNQDKIAIIRSAIKTVTGRDPGEITEDTAIASFDIDSLSEVEIQMEIEELVDTSIPDPTQPLVTVKDLMNLIP